MLKRLSRQDNDERFAARQNRREVMSDPGDRGSLLDIMGEVPQQVVAPEKQRLGKTVKTPVPDGQGSFLDLLGTVSADAQRQRDLARTTQRIEQDLRQREAEISGGKGGAEPPGTNTHSANVHSTGPDVPEHGYRPAGPAGYYQHPGPDSFSHHASPPSGYSQPPASHHAQPASTGYQRQDVAAPSIQPSTPNYSGSHAGPSRVSQTASQSHAPNSHVEEQLDLLSEKLAGVRSRIRQNGATGTSQPQAASAHPVPPMQSSEPSIKSSSSGPSAQAQAPSQHPSRGHATGGYMTGHHEGGTYGGGGYGSGADSPFSLAKVVRAVTKTWKWIILGTIVGMAIGVGVALSIPNKYEAVAEVLIEPRGLKVLDNSVAPDTLNSEATVAYAESQLSIMRSLSVLNPVIEELKLDQDPEFVGTARSFSLTGLLGFGSENGKSGGNKTELARKYLQENLWISRTSQTFVIRIGVESEDPEKSRDIANAIARSYIRDESGARSSAARNASEDLQGQLPALRQRVEVSEREVEQHKRDNNLVSLGDQSVNQAQLSRLTDQMAIAKVQTGDMRVRAQIAENTDLSNVISGALPSSLNSPELKRLRTQYASTQTGIRRLAVKLGPKHPKRVTAQAELSGIRDAIRQEVNRIVRSAKEEYARAQAREAELSEQIAGQQEKLALESGATIKLRELELKARSDRALYEKFFARSRETGGLENIRSESARLLSPAVAPLEKKGPNRKLIVATAGVLGGGLFGILALIPFFIGGLRQLISGLHDSGTPPAPGVVQGATYGAGAGVAAPPLAQTAHMVQAQQGDLYSTTPSGHAYGHAYGQGYVQGQVPGQAQDVRGHDGQGYDGQGQPIYSDWHTGR